MSNILTDILGFFKRRKFVDKNKPDDVLILGINEEPDMLGVASPVPYKDVKLIKVKDLEVQAVECERINLGSTGLPLPDPTPSNVAGVFKDVTTDSEGDCFTNFRSLKSVSLNLSVTENTNDIEISTLGEPNTASNVGSGAGLFKDKLGEVLRFKSLSSSDGSISISEGADEIDITTSIQSGGFSPVNVANCDTAPTLDPDNQFYYQTVSEETITITKAKVWGAYGSADVTIGIYRGTLQNGATLVGQGTAPCGVSSNEILLGAEVGETLSFTPGEDMVVGIYTNDAWAPLKLDGYNLGEYGVFDNTNPGVSMPSSVNKSTGTPSVVRFAITLY